LNGYIVSIIGTVLVCSVLTAVLPQGKTTGVIKGMARLACVVAIIAPIPKYLGKWTSFDVNHEKNPTQADINFSQQVIQTDDTFIKYYCEMRIRNTEAALKSEIENQFPIEVETNIDWRFTEEKTVDSDQIQIVSITVKLLNSCNQETIEALTKYLTKNYCSEVIIE